ncbi:MAG: hypothetical protein FIB01_07560 [Gemmatimonadetes bacterium]|nr:hypothetical protein [Gemmatimonadota bacterium]
MRARGELKAGALDRLVDGARIFKDLPLEYVTPPVAAQIGSAWRARVDVREPRLLVITEVRGLGRGYRNALLRMRQLCRADGSRLLVALETDRDAAALDPFFPDARSRRVAELATRIVRFRPGPRRAGTLRVLDRKLGIEFRVRVGLSGPELRIVERSARGGSSRA